MTTMAIAYTRMGRVLWSNNVIGEGEAVQRHHQIINTSKHKVVIMLIWGQFNAYNVVIFIYYILNSDITLWIV